MRRVEKGNERRLPEKVSANFDYRNSRHLPTRIGTRAVTGYLSVGLSRNIGYVSISVVFVY